jgi:hypothetical protein
MRRLTRLVVAAALVPTALVVAAPPGQTQPDDCHAGRACVYTGDNFRGDRSDFGRDRFDSRCISIDYRSFKNRTADENAFVYPDEHCGGRSGVTMVQPGNDLITGDHRSIMFSRDLQPDPQP